jgi:NADH:ubiquinone oxidoreductase subunit 2 (subunit N)
MGKIQFIDLGIILSLSNRPLTVSVGIIMIMVAFFFKVGIVPFHQ